MKLALRSAVLALLMSVPASAYEIETGSGVICDTRAQAERLAALLDQDTQAAIRAVNAEVHDPVACVFATLSYVRGAKAGTARSKAGTFDIVEVLVIGMRARRGMLPTKPATYFTLFKIDEQGV